MVDTKDIGEGWKTTLGKPKSTYSAYTQVSTNEEGLYLGKRGMKSTVVKRKILIDEKDVGKGWRPARSWDFKKDLKAYESSGSPPPPKEIKQKKKIVDEKDLGKGWKPGGARKQEYPPAMSNEAKPNASANKPPLPKTATKSLPGKPRATSPPKSSTQVPKAKASEKPPLPKSGPKSKNIITSTPNMSKDFLDENPLDASIIEKSEDDEKGSKKQSSENKKEPEKRDKNETGETKSNENESKPITEDVTTKKDDSVKEESEVHDNNDEKAKIEEENKTESEIKETTPRKEKSLVEEKSLKEEKSNQEENSKEMKKDSPTPPNEKDKKEKDETNADEEAKNLVFRRFFDVDLSKKDEETSSQKDEPNSKSNANVSKPNEEASKAELDSDEDGDTEAHKNNSVFKVVDEDEDGTLPKKNDKLSKKTENDSKPSEEKKKDSTKTEEKKKESNGKEDSQLWNFKDSEDE